MGFDEIIIAWFVEQPLDVKKIYSRLMSKNFYVDKYRMKIRKIDKKKS